MAVKFKWYLPTLEHKNGLLSLNLNLKLKLFYPACQEKDYANWNTFIGQAKMLLFISSRLYGIPQRSIRGFS
jgi:hypothetical protein